MGNRLISEVEKKEEIEGYKSLNVETNTNTTKEEDLSNMIDWKKIFERQEYLKEKEKKRKEEERKKRERLDKMREPEKLRLIKAVNDLILNSNSKEMWDVLYFNTEVFTADEVYKIIKSLGIDRYRLSLSMFPHNYAINWSKIIKKKKEMLENTTNDITK